MQLHSAEASDAARAAQPLAHDPPRRPCLLGASAAELGYGLTPAARGARRAGGARRRRPGDGSGRTASWVDCHVQETPRGGDVGPRCTPDRVPRMFCGLLMDFARY